MIGKIKALLKKYEEMIAYLIVGGLTTIVSWVAMYLASWLLFGNPMHPTPFQNVVMSLVNWVAGVIFAYFTNRRFVFKSHEPMLKEAPKFVLSRVSTLFLELATRQICGWLGVNTYITTFVAAVLVFLGNYILSKLLVFKKNPQNHDLMQKEQDKENCIPKCPICGSTNINKITVGNRAVKTVFFGVVGAIDDAGKTYKCGNCGSKF